MSFYFYLLFFKQYLHSALSLNCLRGPIPQYHCRSFTGITPELKVCSTERKRSMVELSAIFSVVYNHHSSRKTTCSQLPAGSLD